MTVAHAIAGVALTLVVALQVASAVGVLTMRDAYQRLHFLAPPCTLGVALLVIAVVAEERSVGSWAKVSVVAFLLALMNGVLSHATARATFVSDNGVEELGGEEPK